MLAMMLDAPRFLLAEESAEQIVIRGAHRDKLEFCPKTRDGAGPVSLWSLRVFTPAAVGPIRFPLPSTVDILWMLLPAHGKESAPVAGCIRYGVAPTGFGSIAPKPLLNGRYYLEVVANGTKLHRIFTVAGDGTVRPMD